MIGKSVSHYQIVAPLGRGGMGEVYRAIDTGLERQVALKFLPSQMTRNEASVERFVREARAASALNHPNIVTIHEIGESRDGHFIVMELIEGRTLRSMIGQTCDLPQLSSLAEQLLKALAVAHEAGIIHRDIKPENIMVRSDGYLKLLDFGLARLSSGVADSVGSELSDSTETIEAAASSGSANTREGALAGTLRYMSPEQAQAQVLDTSTDMFSVGTVLYELSTGRHPFARNTPLAVLQAILLQAPVRPAQLRSELAGHFEDLILRLLDKNPRLRPTAAEAVQMLGDLRGATTSPVAVPSFRVAAHQLVGRDRELNELRTVLGQVTRRHGMFVCVSGEPGMGKTSLVETFLRELSVADAAVNVGSGRCSQNLAGTGAYLPIVEALDTLVHGPDGASLADLMRRIAPTWHAQVATTAEEGTPVRASSLEHLKRELSAFLQEASRSRPLILFLEDLHWADVSTVDLLGYLAGKFDSMRLLIVGTYRPADLLMSQRHPFLETKLDLQGRGLCREIPLDFLKLDDVEAYLEVEFPEHRFPPAFAALIQDKTEGNALFMVNLIRYLRDRRVIAESEGKWVVAQPVQQIESQLPESVRGVIERKIGQLGDPERRVLMAASVQGNEFDSQVVSAILKADAGDVEDQLQLLERVYGFVRFVQEEKHQGGSFTVRYRFVHGFYKNAFYALLTPTRRVSYSAAAAGILLDRHGRESSGGASELAMLFEAAREPARAVEYYFIAAQQAARIFANRETGELARRALGLLRTLPDAGDRAEQELALCVTLGVALMTTRGYGDPEVEKTYVRAEELCHQLGEDIKRFPILWGLYTFSYVRARMGKAVEFAGQLLRLAENAGNLDVLMQSHVAQGITLLTAGSPEPALEHLREAMAIYDPERRSSNVLAAGHDAGVLARCYAARSLWCLGYPDQALDMSFEALELARARSHPYSTAFAMAYVAIIYESRLEPARALSHADATIRLSREEGFPNFIARGRILRGWALTRLGEADAGVSELQRAIDTLESTGTEVTRSHNLALLADSERLAGRTRDARETVTEGIAWIGRTHVYDYEPELYRLRGELLLMEAAGAGDRSASLAGAPADSGAPSYAPPGYTAAETAFRRAIHLARERQSRSWELRAATSLAGLLRSQGKEAEARGLLSETYAWFREGFDTEDLVRARSLLEEVGA